MKTLSTIIVAGALAAATIAATASGASAGGYPGGPYPGGPYYPHYHHHDFRGGGDGGAAVAAGIFGLAAGLIASQAFQPSYPEPQPYYAYPTNAHIDWCSATYRSYSPETDTWRDYQGFAHQCIAPY